MTLKMALRWKNPDASSDINLRYKDVFQKGFVSGGQVQRIPSVLQVQVTPFVLVNFDGAVVTSDTNEALTVTDGQINYVVCRARYRLQDSPVLQLQVLTEAAYLADPELDWLHVLGVADLSSGGPYSEVPDIRIFYDARDEIDQQGRTSWRPPVDTFGSLPTPPYTGAERNFDGDIRLVLDTGSLFWWDEGTTSWSIFDEVPLRNHRDLEHHNGITGASDPTTLEPDVAGLDLTVGPVPAGSSYTVNGQLLTAPLGTVNISAAGVGAVRGLLQVAMDENGSTVTNYRVQSTDIIDIGFARIIDISPGHALGSFSLIYDSVGTTLSWASGEPITVVTGNTYRLPAPDGLNWIDVQLVGAAPGIVSNDNYTVAASLVDDDHLLVGHWYWDGSGLLLLGADKRVFGNLSTPEIHDDFKNQELHPRWEDLRGNMVFSGGDVSDLGGLTARVEGPIVAYINGRRFEVGGAWNGLVLVGPAATNYIYVNSSGVLTTSTTNPATTGDDYATIATVVTSGGSISTITDTRDPQLIMGAATRNSRLLMSGEAELRATHTPSTVNYNFLRNGVLSGANLSADDIEANGDLISAGGNVEAQAGNVIADGDVIATSGDILALGGDIVANNGDIIASLGDLIASTGGVTALAGLIRGLNLTADNDLTVENASALKNLVTLGANLLSAIGDGDSPRISIPTLGNGDTATAPGPMTLLAETDPNGTGGVSRIYSRTDDGVSGRSSLILTINAAWSNSTALWTRDVGGSSDSFKLEIGFTSGAGALEILFQFRDGGTAGATWADSSWDEDVLDINRSSIRHGDSAFQVTSATGYSDLSTIWRINGRNYVGSGFDVTQDFVNLASGALSHGALGGDDAGGLRVMRDASVQEQVNGGDEFYFAETMHGAQLTGAGGSSQTIAVIDLPDDGGNYDSFTVFIREKFTATAIPGNTGVSTSRIGAYKEITWMVGNNGTGSFTSISPTAAGNVREDDVQSSDGDAVAWSALSLVHVSGTTYEVRGDALTNDLGEVDTFVGSMIEMHVGRRFI